MATPTEEMEQRRRLPETIIYVEQLHCDTAGCTNHRWSWIGDDVVICRRCGTVGNVVTYDDTE